MNIKKIKNGEIIEVKIDTKRNNKLPNSLDIKSTDIFKSSSIKGIAPISNANYSDNKVCIKCDKEGEL